MFQQFLDTSIILTIILLISIPIYLRNFNIRKAGLAIYNFYLWSCVYKDQKINQFHRTYLVTLEEEDKEIFINIGNFKIQLNLHKAQPGTGLQINDHFYTTETEDTNIKYEIED